MIIKRLFFKKYLHLGQISCLQIIKSNYFSKYLFEWYE